MIRAVADLGGRSRGSLEHLGPHRAPRLGRATSAIRDPQPFSSATMGSRRYLSTHVVSPASESVISAMTMASVGDLCISRGERPRAAGGRLSRCLPCLKADVAHERQDREARQAKARSFNNPKASPASKVCRTCRLEKPADKGSSAGIFRGRREGLVGSDFLAASVTCLDRRRSRSRPSA